MTDIRRQLGQYKRMVKEQQQMLRWVWIFWALPIPIVLLSFYFDWHWAGKALSIFAVVTGVMTHSDVTARIWLYETKIEELQRRSKY